MPWSDRNLRRLAGVEKGGMEEPDDDRPLVTAAQRDRRQFTALYERNVDAVHAYVYRRVDNRAEAEDITSLVFQKALANLDRFEWRGVPFVAWLLRIAANAVTNHWRRVSREQPMADLDGPEPAPADPADIDALERRALLFRLVRTLPVDQRRVIEMRFADERGIREIARELNRTESAVKQLQYRAIQNLRAQLQKSPGKKRSGEANA